MVLIFVSCSSNLQFMNAKSYKFISFNWTCYFEVFGIDLAQFISIFLIILRLNNNGNVNFRPLFISLITNCCILVICEDYIRIFLFCNLETVSILKIKTDLRKLRVCFDQKLDFICCTLRRMIRILSDE